MRSIGWGMGPASLSTRSGIGRTAPSKSPEGSMRLASILSLLVLAAVGCFSTALAASAGHPRLVAIVGDDRLDAGDWSFHRWRDPGIESALASRGIDRVSLLSPRGRVRTKPGVRLVGLESSRPD